MSDRPHSIADDRKTVRYYLNIVAEEDAHAEAIAALERIEEQLETAERERDDYRFWNERVRTCEHHTQDVAAPVGDCLICTIERLSEFVESGNWVRASDVKLALSEIDHARRCVAEEAKRIHPRINITLDGVADDLRRAEEALTSNPASRAEA